MRAVAERVHVDDERTYLIVWHKPAQPEQCNGECDFHQIACSETEGINAPGPLRDVPSNLDEPSESWCLDCLTIVRGALPNSGG